MTLGSVTPCACAAAISWAIGTTVGATWRGWFPCGCTIGIFRTVPSGMGTVTTTTEGDPWLGRLTVNCWGVGAAPGSGPVPAAYDFDCASHCEEIGWYCAIASGWLRFSWRPFPR